MSIPVVLAAQDSSAHGVPGVVLSALLGDHDKVLARGARGLGERTGTAAVPSRAGWGGTAKGGQEMHICTPRRVFQLLSCRDQSLLGCGISPSHRTWQPPCCRCRSPPGRHSHPHTWGWCRFARLGLPLRAGHAGTRRVWRAVRSRMQEHLSPLPAQHPLLPGDPHAPLSMFPGCSVIMALPRLVLPLAVCGHYLRPDHHLAPSLRLLRSARLYLLQHLDHLPVHCQPQQDLGQHWHPVCRRQDVR